MCDFVALHSQSGSIYQSTKSAQRSDGNKGRETMLQACMRHVKKCIMSPGLFHETTSNQDRREEGKREYRAGGLAGMCMSSLSTQRGIQASTSLPWRSGYIEISPTQIEEHASLDGSHNVPAL